MIQLSIQKLFLDLNGLKSQEDFLQSSAHPCGEQNGGSENIFPPVSTPLPSTPQLSEQQLNPKIIPVVSTLTHPAKLEDEREGKQTTERAKMVSESYTELMSDTPTAFCPLSSCHKPVTVMKEEADDEAPNEQLHGAS
ncbi:unnamed protein product [Leuciscus chuanchicus]